MVRPELIARWHTPDGLRRRERLLALQLRGPWREVLAGFPGSAELGDNLGNLRGIDLSQEELSGADLVRARLDRGGAAHPQLTVAVLLTDPDFEARARVRLERSGDLKEEVRASLAWAYALVRGEPLPASTCQRWLSGLRRHVDPSLQALWRDVPRVPTRSA